MAAQKLLEYSEQIRSERLAKATRTRETRMENDPRYVRHFGQWIDTSRPTSKLTRDTYASINNRSSIYSYSDGLCELRDGNTTIYLDENDHCVRYTEEFCSKHQQRCLENFDLNMARFQALDHTDFDRVLLKFAKGRKFREVTSLDDPICTTSPFADGVNLAGFVYIMVLDEYKQVYIGITESTVKQRILQHWKQRRAFDRLIFGSIETSAISIDSFGALDTTRLFVLPYEKTRKTWLQKYEMNCFRIFDQRYLLNRIK